MQVLERNLAALHAVDPELARLLAGHTPAAHVSVYAARSGAPAIAVGEALECSSEDPDAEGRALASHFQRRASEAGARRLVLFGMGVHTLRHLHLDGELLIIEPSLDVAHRVLSVVDLSSALSRGSLLVSDAPERILRHPVFSSGTRGLLLAHAPARRRARELHDFLASRFHPGGTPSALDIAVVGPMYGGSLPVATASARALREIGHRVREVDLTPFWPAYQQVIEHTSDPRLRSTGERLRAQLTRLIGESIVSSFRLNPPDLVFALAQAPLDTRALEDLARLGIPRALWFCEDFRVMTWWSSVARLYDVIFHVQPGSFDGPLREAGGFGHPLPMAFDPTVHRPVQLDAAEHARFDCDLSFVGAGYHNRIQFLPALVSLGLRIYGTDWPLVPPLSDCMPEPNVRQSSEDSNRIFNASRINLNLHSSPWVDGVNPLGDYLNPRVFELAGAGAFQLVDERSALRDAFYPGREIETYRDLEECRRKISAWLAHPDERREQASAARRRALDEHTYAHRMQDAMRVIESGPVPVLPRCDVQGSVGSTLAAADGEPELRAILGRVDPSSSMSGDAIRLAISRGSGELSRTEMLLLYLRESAGEVVVREEAA
jgi:spore maturation protein CgeB